MIKDCLRNAPAQRPTAEQLVAALNEMKEIIEGDYGELATVDAVRRVRTMKALKSRNDDKVSELAVKDERIQQLQQQLAVSIL
jgi:methylthioribose-1-phosphate isomerase